MASITAATNVDATSLIAAEYNALGNTSAPPQANATGGPWTPGPHMKVVSSLGIVGGTSSIVACCVALVAFAMNLDSLSGSAFNRLIMASIACQLVFAAVVVVSCALMLAGELRPYCTTLGFLNQVFNTGSILFAFYFYVHAIVVLQNGQGWLAKRMERCYWVVAVAVTAAGIAVPLACLGDTNRYGTRMTPGDLPWCWLPHNRNSFMIDETDSPRMVMMRFFLMYVWWFATVVVGGVCFYMFYKRRSGFPVRERRTRVLIARGVYFGVVASFWGLFAFNRIIESDPDAHTISSIQSFLDPFVGTINAMVFLYCERPWSRRRGGLVLGLTEAVESIGDIFGCELPVNDSFPPSTNQSLSADVSYDSWGRRKSSDGLAAYKTI